MKLEKKTGTDGKHLGSQINELGLWSINSRKSLKVSDQSVVLSDLLFRKSAVGKVKDGREVAEAGVYMAGSA